jgi:hypothetical protein
MKASRSWRFCVTPKTACLCRSFAASTARRRCLAGFCTANPERERELL